MITPHLRVMAQAMGHSPAGVAIHPCHGFIRGEVLLINTYSQRVLHHNLGLQWQFKDEAANASATASRRFSWSERAALVPPAPLRPGQELASGLLHGQA